MKGKPREDQEWVVLNGKHIIVDKDFSLLLQELNRVGLVTAYHCAGHESTCETPYICFDIKAIKGCMIEVHDGADSGHTQLVIRWDRFDVDKDIYYDKEKDYLLLGGCHPKSR